jgi:hypothetical protein
MLKSPDRNRHFSLPWRFNMDQVIVNPTPADVEKACAQFDEQNKVLEESLRRLFAHFRGNAQIEDVYLKVTALNALYGTQIPVYSERIPDIQDVANLIAECGIDGDLEQGSDQVVAQIANVEVPGKASRYNYSFATKYCSWHRPEFYPIFDSRVNEYLWHLRRHKILNQFHREELWDYPELKGIITEFQNKFGLGAFTFKQIDKFLYEQGGILFNQKYQESPKVRTAPKELAESGESSAREPESTEEYLLAQGYTPEQVADIKKKHTDSDGWVVGGIKI